jgi:hypothetical protein
MSDQEEKLVRLKEDFLGTVACLRVIITMAHSAGRFPYRIEMIKLAAAVVPNFGEGYFDTLGKGPVSKDPTFQHWELIRLIAEQGSELAAQVVNHGQIDQEDWINIQRKLNEIASSVIQNLTRMKTHFDTPLQFDSIISGYVKGRAIEKLADEVYDQAPKICEL